MQGDDLRAGRSARSVGDGGRIDTGVSGHGSTGNQ